MTLKHISERNTYKSLNVAIFWNIALCSLYIFYFLEDGDSSNYRCENLKSYLCLLSVKTQQSRSCVSYLAYAKTVN
jgi:hypothetical protein